MGKMKIFKLLAVAAILAFGWDASALIEVSGLLGYSLAGESVSGQPPLPTITGKGSFGYGVQADLKIPDSSYGLGVGLWAITATAEQVIPGTFDLTYGVPYLQLPVTVRYDFLDIFSLGLGLYYAFTAGNVSENGNFGGVPVNTTTSPSSASVKGDDYGLVVDGAVYIPIGAITSITGRVVYEDGLENVSTVSGVTAHTSEFIFLAGVAFGI